MVYKKRTTFFCIPFFEGTTSKAFFEARFSEGFPEENLQKLRFC